MLHLSWALAHQQDYGDTAAQIPPTATIFRSANVYTSTLSVTSKFQQGGKLSENPLHAFSQMCVLVFVSVQLPTKGVDSGKALGSHLQMIFIVCLF